MAPITVVTIKSRQMGRFTTKALVFAGNNIVIQAIVEDRRERDLVVMIARMHIGKQSNTSSKGWMGQKKSF